MSPAAHMALAENFGEPEPPHPLYPHLEGYPSIMRLDFGGDAVPDTDVWHTDVTYRGSPPFASMLHGHTIPPVGGDTLWLSMTAAYERLSPGLKSDLSSVRCVHDMGDFRNNFTRGKPDGQASALADAHTRMGSAIHPLVQTHPATGQRIPVLQPGLHGPHRGNDGFRFEEFPRFSFRSHHSARIPGPFSVDARRRGNLGQQMYHALRTRRLCPAKKDHAPDHGHRRSKTQDLSRVMGAAPELQFTPISMLRRGIASRKWPWPRTGTGWRHKDRRSGRHAGARNPRSSPPCR